MPLAPHVESPPRSVVFLTALGLALSDFHCLVEVKGGFPHPTEVTAFCGGVVATRTFSDHSAQVRPAGVVFSPWLEVRRRVLERAEATDLRRERPLGAQGLQHSRPALGDKMTSGVAPGTAGCYLDSPRHFKKMVGHDPIFFFWAMAPVFKGHGESRWQAFVVEALLLPLNGKSRVVIIA